MICSACHATLEAAAAKCPQCGGSTRLRDRYRLESMLGSGGQGTTYKAHDEGEGRDVAVKELSIAKVSSLKAIELFEREAETLRALEHPGIPTYYDEFTVEEGRHVYLYIVQELVEGEVLSWEQAWTEKAVFAMVEEICEILVYLHALRPSVVHRDIKPANIMRRHDGTLALIDFGAVKGAVDADSRGGSTVAGTFGFMAPEQLRGVAAPASDIYGLGATALSLLAGKDASELIDLARPSAWKDQVPMSPAAMGLLTQMLDPSMDRRIGSARKLARSVRSKEWGTRATGSAVEAPKALRPPKPRRPADERTLERRLDRRWKRMRFAESLRAENIPSFPWFFFGSLFAGVFCWPAVDGLLSNLASANLAEKASFPLAFIVSGLGATVLGLWLLSVRRGHPVHATSLFQVVSRTWDAKERWSANLREWFDNDATAYADRDWGYREAFKDEGQDSFRMLPAQEALAFGHAMQGNFVKATRTLDRCLGVGKATFTETGPAYVDQLRRYAPVFAQSEARRGRAIEMAKEAQASVMALEAEREACFEDLVDAQLRACAEQWLPKSQDKGIPDEEVDRALSRVRFLLTVSDFTPRPWMSGDLLNASLVLVFPTVILMSFLVALAGGDDAVSGATTLGIAFASFLFLFFVVSTAGALVHGRLWGRTWRARLFDDVAERFESEQRGEQLVELVSQVWEAGFVSKDELWKKLRSLKKTGNLRDVERTLLLELELAMSGSLDRIHAVWAKLESAPVHHRERRIRVLQMAARHALIQAHGKDTARAIMLQLMLLER